MRLISKDKVAGKTVIEFEGSEFVDLLAMLRTVRAEYSALRVILDLSREQVEEITDAL